MSYKLPRKDAEWIVKKYGGMHFLHYGGLHGAILSGIRQFVADHKVIDLPNLNGSLAKRIALTLRDFFLRLLADKYLINWLAANRIDLNTIDGEFRRSLVERIKMEENRKKQLIKEQNRE